jgi:hypothetical protein
MASQVVPPQESTAPPARALDMGQVPSVPTGEAAVGEGAEGIDAMAHVEQPQDRGDETRAGATEIQNRTPAMAETLLENERDATLDQGTSKRTDPENHRQGEIAGPEGVADHAMGNDSMAVEAPISTAPSTSAIPKTARTDVAPSTPAHGLNKVVERKEPAVLGDFVSLAEMEGRQHLRFNSKSPEVSPALDYYHRDLLLIAYCRNSQRRARKPRLSQR